ncbi:hypothetical protein BCR33DRAFT_852737 [Rhizoclosmatium globosum]|uniref:TFG box profile domain-containing protein n=1 Tax=Rhizoclosmatium globosum TaxID=329046 RepID=A0A1Y2C0K7_9FUNG|nr:hypothetical protein BCR33DRAFT_852737 [Rhizoclosmatium globosum]|eukprot:ORY40407.1 hypothetical protein BCR33DRAFT_852737 [Rhizoclosmatium globosum]
MDAFIGATISLISKSDIRYIGVLHSINQLESTVALENVRSLGTEGRKANPSDEILGSSQVFEFIVFRGSDIKDLQVVTAPAAPTVAPAVPSDPAIVSHKKPAPAQVQAPPAASVPAPAPASQSQPPQKTIPAVPAVAKPSEPVKPFSKQPQAAVEDVSNRMGNLRVADQKRNVQQQQQHQQQQQTDPGPSNSNAVQLQTQRGGRNGGRGGSHRNNQSQQPRPAFVVPSSDFDFESANAKFNKSEVVTIRPEASAQDEDADSPDSVSRPALPTTVTDESFYDKKSSFFDNISCEARDRAEGERRVVRGQEERKLNMETFGQTSVEFNRNRRGGRGGGRGRGGRGYYHNQRNGGQGSFAPAPASDSFPVCIQAFLLDFELRRAILSA